MSKKNLTLIISICILLYAIVLHAQDKPPVPTIEVFGSANIKVVPDLMKWDMNVQVENDDLGLAKEENDKSVSKVLTFLKEEGIENKDIQTQGIRVSKNNNIYNSNAKKFTASDEIWFTLKDINRYDKITTGLLKIDNVFISNTFLEYSKAIEIKVQARTDALNAAKKKAENMASVLGQSIGRPLLIQEEPNTYYPNPFNASTENLGTRSFTETNSTFSEGTINIEAKVKVVFELINQ
jgi:hypothetical protein